MATINVSFNRPGIARESRVAVGAFTEALLASCLEDLGWSHAEVSVLYCSRAEIRRLNREFRQLDEETDVLSFPESERPKLLKKQPAPYLGDLAICIPYCADHAAEHGRTTGEEVKLLLVHGLLHLLGWDHDTAKKEKAMWAETDRLLVVTRGVSKPRLAL